MSDGPASARAMADLVVGRAAFISAIGGYLLMVTVATTVVGAADQRTAPFWMGAVAALICFTVAFAVTLGPQADGCGRAAAIVAAAFAVAGQAAIWWAAVADPADDFVAYEPLAATAYVIYVMLVFRDQLVIAWCGAGAGLVISVALGPRIGTDDWWSALQTTSLFVFAICTVAFIALDPLLGEIDALAIRHRRVVAERGLAQTAGERREQRIERIDQRVRPMLAEIVRAGAVTSDDVAVARLIEARLRDGIRAPAFDTEAVRDAVWRARARGVSVTLLDDGGLRDMSESDATVYLTHLIEMLCAELDALSDGEVIARVAPRGRIPLAMVTVALRDTRRRIEFGADGHLTRVVQA